MIKIIVKESMRLLKRWIMSNWIMKLKNQFLLFILKSLTLYTLKNTFFNNLIKRMVTANNIDQEKLVCS